jgi:hypothetical protein
MAPKKETKFDREARARAEHKVKHARRRKAGINSRNWSRQ